MVVVVGGGVVGSGVVGGGGQSDTGIHLLLT